MRKNYINVYNNVTIKEITDWLNSTVKNGEEEPDDKLVGKAIELAEDPIVENITRGLIPSLIMLKLTGRDTLTNTLAVGIMMGFQVGYEYRDKDEPESIHLR